ncbi:MAG: aldose 1-epimerase family protein, partial [Chloroflexota bacterium]
RGMDIWTAHYKGIPLTWISQGSPHPPDFGQTWLQQFNGGLLTTCGLTHVGPPEKDDLTGEMRGIHGDYTRLRAQDIWVDRDQKGGWSEISAKEFGEFEAVFEAFFANYPHKLASDALPIEPKFEAVTKNAPSHNYDLILHGTIYQTSLFGNQFKVDRSIHLSLGDPSFGLSDIITNMGDRSVPLMLLYHINLGFPLIQAGTQLYAQHAHVYPRDAAAKAGYESWSHYNEATPGYPEQVFYHHMSAYPYREEDSGTSVLFANKEEDFGIYLTWEANSLPYLSQWKNTRQGLYVSGIEPGNCIPEGQNAARKNGRLLMHEPGQQIETSWGITVIDDARSIEIRKDIIQRFQRKGTALPNCHLDDYGQFAE